MNNENRDDFIGNNNNLDNFIIRETHVNDDNTTVNRQGIAPIDRRYENEVKNEDTNRLVRRRVNNNRSWGFSNIKFIVTTILVSMITGILVGYLIVK